MTRQYKIVKHGGSYYVTADAILNCLFGTVDGRYDSWAEAKKLFDRVNNERKERGLRPLVMV